MFKYLKSYNVVIPTVVLCSFLLIILNENRLNEFFNQISYTENKRTFHDSQNIIPPFSNQDTIRKSDIIPSIRKSFVKHAAYYNRNEDKNKLKGKDLDISSRTFKKKLDSPLLNSLKKKVVRQSTTNYVHR